MLIQDLNHLEVVSEESNIEGSGLAIANADAYSSASGQNFAGTRAYTSTSVSSGYYSCWYYYGPSSSSSSFSAAAAS